MMNKEVKVELAVGESSLAFTGTEDLFREAFPDLLEKVLSAPVASGTSIPPLKVRAEDVSNSRAELDIVGRLSSPERRQRSDLGHGRLRQVISH